MKTTTFLQGAMIGLGSLMLAVSGQAQASGGAWVPGLTKAKSGRIVCGGFYKRDDSHRSRWVIRNDNEKANINIDRIRLYNKTGDLKLDTLIDPHNPSAGIWEDKNGILRPGQSVLAAHQTAKYRSEELQLLWGGNSWGPGNVQAVLDWSAYKRVIPPAVTLVRLVYDSSGTYLLARSAIKCNRVK